MNRFVIVGYDTDSKETEVLFFKGSHLVTSTKVENVSTSDLAAWVLTATLPNHEKLGWKVRQETETEYITRLRNEADIEASQ